MTGVLWLLRVERVDFGINPTRIIQLKTKGGIVKRYIFTAVALVAAVGLLAGCGARKVDEKLDTEYEESSFAVNLMVNEIDSSVQRMNFRREVHDKQDEKLARYITGSADAKMQADHVKWFTEFEQTLNEISEWLEDARNVLHKHEEMEATHGKAKADKIKDDHKMMLADLERLEEETREKGNILNEADSIVATFFTDHAYLNEKYNVPSEHALKPPTAK